MKKILKMIFRLIKESNRYFYITIEVFNNTYIYLWVFNNIQNKGSKNTRSLWDKREKKILNRNKRLLLVLEKLTT